MVAVIIFIYNISIFWSFCFIPWCVNENIDFAEAMFVCFCPVLNTIFAGYRTYRYFKNGGKFL